MRKKSENAFSHFIIESLSRCLKFICRRYPSYFDGIFIKYSQEQKMSAIERFCRVCTLRSKSIHSGNVGYNRRKTAENSCHCGVHFQRRTITLEGLIPWRAIYFEDSQKYGKHTRLAAKSSRKDNFHYPGSIDNWILKLPFLCVK